LFNKIVVMKRGGFCYELNGLFHWLLRELGFHVRLASGRVYDRHRGGYGPDFDHMLILAECAGHSWLVDVGFGDFSMRPLACTVHHPLTDRNGVFVIERHDDAYFKVSRFSLNDKVYLPQYLFSTGEQCLEDFSDMCLYHQTSPESHFTTGRICSIATATGRITLTDDRLILTESGVRTESVIRDEGEFGRALVQYFNIVQ
jgi:N-hydroxyarylamine O-acetyltransferase